MVFCVPYKQTYLDSNATCLDSDATGSRDCLGWSGGKVVLCVPYEQTSLDSDVGCLGTATTGCSASIVAFGILIAF